MKLEWFRGMACFVVICGTTVVVLTLLKYPMRISEQRVSEEPHQRSGLAQEAEVFGFELVHVYPPDPQAYTQGLFYEDGYIFEGTGRHGGSSLRKVDLVTGTVLKKVKLPSVFFGEGIASYRGRIYQLTWQSGIGFIYDKGTLGLKGQFRYPTEGWGLTADGRYLIMSDGSSFLRFLDPVSFDEVRRLRVHDVSGPIRQLNELEFIKDYIYANVWGKDQILKISPNSGEVLARFDLSGLLAAERPHDPEAVLNGIAYDSDGDRVFVTGKLWPYLFEVRFGQKGR